jgi:8-oxo-dGTP pyrophosphatase MutT (NUDIX family)
MDSPVQQAGAVVFRRHNRNVEVLLVYSKRSPRVRIFPKGHVEPDETAQEAAVRELCEEAGVTGELIRELGMVSYENDNRVFEVRYFLFDYHTKLSDGEPGRNPSWYTFDEACKLLPFSQLQQILYGAV